MVFDQAAGCSDAVQAWHPDVHENQIRMVAPDGNLRVLAIGRLSDNLDVGLAFEDQPEAGTDHGLVVGNQDPDHVGS